MDLQAKMAAAMWNNVYKWECTVLNEPCDLVARYGSYRLE
jgi:hypothetical protein